MDLVNHLEACACGLRERLVVEEDREALLRAASDTPAKLVQLREPHALGVLDDNKRGVWHVHADLDDGGRDEELDLARLEVRHDLRLLGGLHAAVHEPHGEVGKGRLDRLERLDRGLELERSV